MDLENIVVDAADPARLGRFWATLLGARVITDEPGLLEARLDAVAGPVLDLCFPAVPEPVRPGPRLHLDLAGGEHQSAVVSRALELGARPLDIGQGDPPWVVLADPEGNPFCVMEDRESYTDTGPVAALPLHSADPERDAGFYAALTGWTPGRSGPWPALRHPSGRGPLLELLPEDRPLREGEKNRVHVDVRLDRGDHLPTLVEAALDLGGRVLDGPDAGLPWQVVADPSGNPLCLLPAR